MTLRYPEGLSNKVVMVKFGVHGHTVGMWRRHFIKHRIKAQSDEPRSGRPRTI